MNAPVLAARGISATRGGRNIVERVDVELNRGRVLALLGPSGAGKTTLLRVLHLLEAPSTGGVLLDGRPAPRRGPDWRRALHRVGYVQQRPGLLARSVLENVAFGLRARGEAKPEAQGAAALSLRRVGLESKAQAHATTLSGGEAQRVALARALATRPDILLLDEPTNQLDPASVELVEHALREERARGCALALVTHSPTQARRLADDVAFMEAGKLTEHGPAATTLASPRSETLRRYLAQA